MPWRRRRTTKRPEEPPFRQLAHRQPRLLVIVDPPPGPLPTALRSSVRSPGTSPGIAPQSGPAVNVGPLGQDLEWTFEVIHTSDLSTNWRPVFRTCPPTHGRCGRNAEKSRATPSPGSMRQRREPRAGPHCDPIDHSCRDRGADLGRRRSRRHDRAPARGRRGRRVRVGDQLVVVGEGWDHKTGAGPQIGVAPRSPARQRPDNPPSCRECQRRRGPYRRADRPRRSRPPHGAR